MDSIVSRIKSKLIRNDYQTYTVKEQITPKYTRSTDFSDHYHRMYLSAAHIAKYGTQTVYRPSLADKSLLVRIPVIYDVLDNHSRGVGTKILNISLLYLFKIYKAGQKLTQSALDDAVSKISNLPFDVKINLIYYITVNSDGKTELDIPFNKKELQYIINADTHQLLDLLGPNYKNNPTDHASLLFAVLSGKSSPSPNIEKSTRYQSLIEYPVDKILPLLSLHNRLQKNFNSSPYPPYVFLALEPKLLSEQIVLAVNDQNVGYFADYYDMISLDTIKKYKERAPSQKLSWFYDNIRAYDKVLTRPANHIFPAPVNLPFLDRETTLDNLDTLTNKEIIDIVLPDGHAVNPMHRMYAGVLKNRYAILSHAFDRVCDIEWRFYKNKIPWSCSNDNMLNIETGAIKANDNGTILSYGTHYVFYCYELSELNSCFREDDGNITFLNPDYNPADPTVNIFTGRLMQKEFDLECVKNLQKFLSRRSSNCDTGICLELLNKIHEGIRIKSEEIPKREMNFQLEKSKDLTENERTQIIEYLVWMFLYSMYMRFWKGPGNPYPVNKISKKGEDDSCLPTTRDENIFIQQGVEEELLKSFTERVVDWIDQIKLITYRHDNKIFTITTGKIKDVLHNIRNTTYCMGIGADELLATSYYYLKALTGDTDVNELIERFIEHILDIEKKVVPVLLYETKSLPEVKPSDKEYKLNRISVLRVKIESLRTQPKEQDPFTLEGFTYNVHVNSEQL